MHTAPGAVHEFDVFQYPPSGHWICTVLRDGEPWFAAADIAAALGYRDAHHGLRSVEPTDRGIYRLDTPDGPRDLAVVNESGLYRMIMGARRPDAVGFQLWIVRDVLPTVRGLARYAAAPEPPLPRSYSQALRELASTVERAEAAEASLAEVAPTAAARSEEHTSELQSPCNLVCRLLLEKKNTSYSLVLGWSRYEKH